MKLCVAAAATAIVGVATPALAHPNGWDTWEEYRRANSECSSADEGNEDGGLSGMAVTVQVDCERDLRRAWERFDATYWQHVEAQQVVVETEVVSVGYAAGCDWACIMCESGGNPQAYNPNGHWGLYQFDEGTWAAHGGDPDAYGSAGAAEQHAVAGRITYDAWTCN